MRVRTFIALIFLLSVAAAIVFLLLPNRIILELPLDVGGQRIPVWGALIGAFAVGSLIGLAFQLTGWGRTAYGQARSLWTRRRQDAPLRLIERGKQAEREGRTEAAIDAYREACGGEAPSFRALMHLGDALRRAGRFDEAVTAHERARRLDPESDEPADALAFEYLEAGRVEEARRQLIDLVERRPKLSVGPLRQLRDLEIGVGDWEAAARAALRLERLHGRGNLPSSDRLQHLGIRTQQALRRAAEGDARGAAGQLKKLLAKEPDFVPARMALADVFQQLESTGPAREVLLDGFNRTGEGALLDELVEQDLQRERPEEAISSLRGLVAAQAHLAAARLALGKLYLRLEMHDEAVDQLEQVLEQVEPHPLVGALLAQAEERRGNPARAARVYLQVLEACGPSEARCERCGADVKQWAPRCPECGCFGTVRTVLSSQVPPVKEPTGGNLPPRI